MLTWMFSREGASGFSWAFTADQVTAGLTGIVTVGSARGAHVVMAARNLTAADSVPRAILAEMPAANLDIMELGFSSMASVRDIAAEGLPLNILVSFSLSKDGIKMQFVSKHVGMAPLEHMGSQSLQTFSMLMNMLGDFKEEGVNITANSLLPGGIITCLLRHHSIIDVLHRTLGKLVLKNANQGAASTCYVALHPDVKGMLEKYLSDNNLYEPSEKARDAELARKLGDLCRACNLIADALLS